MNIWLWCRLPDRLLWDLADHLFRDKRLVAHIAFTITYLTDSHVEISAFFEPFRSQAY